MSALRFILPLLLVACGSSGLSHVDTTAEPASHRVVAEACAPSTLGEVCTSLATANECATPADCTDGKDGRCLVGRGGCACSYDACLSDADCAAGSVCLCANPSGRADLSNRCVPANCRTDADCAAGQYCTPTLDQMCGSYLGIARYECTTPVDRCRLDSDCTGIDAGYGNGFCGYFLELGSWACNTALCAG